MAGRDAVALDATGVRIFQATHLAYAGRERPSEPLAHHIIFAHTRHGIRPGAVMDRSRPRRRDPAERGCVCSYNTQIVDYC